jgi:hypothetical protein
VVVCLPIAFFCPFRCAYMSNTLMSALVYASLYVLFSERRPGPEDGDRAAENRNVRPRLSVSPARAAIPLRPEAGAGGPNQPEAGRENYPNQPVLLGGQQNCDENVQANGAGAAENVPANGAAAAASHANAGNPRLKFTTELAKEEFFIPTEGQLEDRHLALLYKYIFADWNAEQLDDLARALTNQHGEGSFASSNCMSFSQPQHFHALSRKASYERSFASA